MHFAILFLFFFFFFLQATVADLQEAIHQRSKCWTWFPSFPGFLCKLLA